MCSLVGFILGLWFNIYSLGYVLYTSIIAAGVDNGQRKSLTTITYETFKTNALMIAI